MGLRVTHGCFDGGYGSFGVLRDELAKAAGYKFVPLTEGLLKGRLIADVDYDDYHDNKAWGRDTLHGYWGRNVPADPLVVLLVHSDVEGKISPTQGRPLAKRLLDLAPRLTDATCRQHATRFAVGLLDAARLREDVVFS